MSAVPQVARTTTVNLRLGEPLPRRFPLWAGPSPCTSCPAMLLCGAIVPLQGLGDFLCDKSPSGVTFKVAVLPQPSSSVLPFDSHLKAPTS